ncbi:unnamed protein product [Effrenium voratum]|nr:unnamed protein product [Effrenium voratum]
MSVCATGEGADGLLETASVLEPRFVAWLHGKLLFVDHCSLRQVVDGRVSTLLGTPGDCAEGNETLQPAFWASKITAPLGLAAESEATAGHTSLLLTAKQVIVTQEEDACAESSRAECAAAGCGWAEGDRSSQRRCFSCKRLQRWADAQRPTVEPCSLEAAQGPARYDLVGCGCAPPKPPAAKDESIAGHVIRLAQAAYWYRQRQLQRRDDFVMPAGAQFHTFSDGEGYVRYDSEPFS